MEDHRHRQHLVAQRTEVVVGSRHLEQLEELPVALVSEYHSGVELQAQRECSGCPPLRKVEFKDFSSLLEFEMSTRERK